LIKEGLLFIQNSFNFDLNCVEVSYNLTCYNNDLHKIIKLVLKRVKQSQIYLHFYVLNIYYQDHTLIHLSVIKSVAFYLLLLIWLFQTLWIPIGNWKIFKIKYFLKNIYRKFFILLHFLHLKDLSLREWYILTFCFLNG